jgi:hypothetical protein
MLDPRECGKERDGCVMAVDVEDIWASISKRSGDHLSKLTQEERVVCRVWRFRLEMWQGGLAGYLYNRSPSAAENQLQWDELRADADAMEVIGA